MYKVFDTEKIAQLYTWVMGQASFFEPNINCLRSWILTLLNPGIWILVNSRGTQRARIQFKGSELLFDLETLCVLSEIYMDFPRKKNWSKSHKVSDILRFEIFLELRFCHDLTHENGRNSLNF